MSPCLLLVVVVAAPPRDDARQVYEKARALYFTLKDNAERQKYRHNWLKVIAGFEAVAAGHGESPEAAAALYTTAELWSDLWRISRRESDLDMAFAAYERVVHGHPQSSLADDALLHRAELYLDPLGNRAAAARSVRELLAEYPAGDMAARAAALAAGLADVPVETAPPTPRVDETEAAPMVGRREGSAVPEILELKHWSNPSYTRVSIYLSGPAQARAGAAVASAGRPARVFVDIRKARVSAKVAAETRVDENLLSGVRVAQFDTTTVRVVLDLKARVTHRVMVMENPYRVVIDAFAQGEPLPPAAALAGRKVVIDPGHGGKDGGAKGPGKLREKEVTLAIATEVAKLLRADGLEVVMTRTTDVHVPLEERTAVANRSGADVFVSIHANSNKSQKVRGVETYYLDVTDDDYALRLAAVENQTSEEQVSDLQLILADLAAKAHTETSGKLARRVQAELVRAMQRASPGSRDLGVKPSLFYVLVGARMPAVLVETGFLSHRDEGKTLGKSDTQKALARAIRDAVIAHLRASEPAVPE